MKSIYFLPEKQMWVDKLPKRFIDRLFRTFTGTEQECAELLGTNKPHPKIKIK